MVEINMNIVSIQMASREGESANNRFQAAEAHLKKLYEAGVRPQQLLFPELWGTGFFAFDRYISQAEPEQGDTFDLMSFWARRLGCHIHTGSFVEKAGASYYNTSLLLNPQGRIIGKYRKIHLFSHNSREAAILTPGSGICVTDTDYGRVGMATCYDLRFPELFRTMVNLGAEYFLITSAWPAARLDHWRLFNQVRAVENQCVLCSCNGVGNLGGCELGGHSMITDPSGQVLAEGEDQEAFVSADVDEACIRLSRSNFSALRDKRLM